MNAAKKSAKKIVLTGGSGDVGSLLTQDLIARGDRVVNIDMAAPKVAGAEFVQGSILNRELVAHALKGTDCVVHIAAWHGVHEATKTAADFHDLNVTGTFNMLQAAAEAGVKRFIFISSTSVEDTRGIYGSTKLMGEKMAQDYAHRHGMEVIILRPRAFIPSWNNAVYKNFLQWADWFMKGAVHIDDFKQATLLAIDLKLPRTAPTFIIDGKYDYSLKDLTEWDKDGAGSTFKKTYPEFVALAQQHGIDTTRKPKVLTPAPTEQLPGYAPQYSMRNLLQELQDFGLAGPAAPFNAKAEGPHHARPLSP